MTLHWSLTTVRSTAVKTAVMNDVLRARDVRKQYGDTLALDDVSVSIPQGEVFGLIGPNGAGKTTLVRALTGTTTVDGELQVLDSDPDAVARTRIGLLPQSFGPPERLSALELLEYYRGLYDDGREPVKLLADVGLSDEASVRYGNLSGGQQRRVCVGTALVNDPDVLFLDEPTTGIDPAGRRALWGLIEGLAAEGTTVFLTSHAMDEVERLADRAGLLRDGRLMEVGSPAELVATHGGQPRLIVRLPGSVRPDTVVKTLEQASGIKRPITAVGGGVAVQGVKPQNIGEIVAVLDAAGVEFESLSWSEPSLEDVYLALTGEPYAPFGDTPTQLAQSHERPPKDSTEQPATIGRGDAEQ